MSTTRTIQIHQITIRLSLKYVHLDLQICIVTCDTITLAISPVLTFLPAVLNHSDVWRDPTYRFSSHTWPPKILSFDEQLYRKWILSNYLTEKLKLKGIKCTHQERGEHGKEGTETKNNRVTNALVQNCMALEETALPHAASIFRYMVIFSRETERWALWNWRHNLNPLRPLNFILCLPFYSVHLL